MDVDVKARNQARKSARQGAFSAPMIIGLLLTLIGFSLLIKLSHWQFQRGIEKRDLLQQIAQFEATGEQPLQQLLSLGYDAEGARTRITPQWQRSTTILLDNKPAPKPAGVKTSAGFATRIGYEVLIPVSVEQRWYLVNLGWIEADPDRNVWPSLSEIQLPETLRVLVKPARSLPVLNRQYLLEQRDSALRFQTLHMETLRQTLQLPLESLVLLADEPIPPLQQAWTFVQLSPQRHFGYSLQWAGLALALLLVAYAVFHHGKKYNKTKEE